MMNFLALVLVLSSLAAAGVWSPAPPAREGHDRLLVVEYERHFHGDRAPEPPPGQLIPEAKDGLHELVDEAKEKIHEPVDEAKDKETHDAARHRHHDLIHEAKDKLEEFKDRLRLPRQELVDEAEDKVHEAASHDDSGRPESMKEKLSSLGRKTKEVMGGTEDAVVDTAGSLLEGGGDVVGNISRIAGKVSDKAGAVAGAFRCNLTDIARLAGEVVRDAAEAAWPGPGQAAAVAQVAAVAVAYGTGVWVTFVSSHVLAAALPRQQFGVVQSKLYPVYFRVVGYSVGAALVAHFAGRDRSAAAEKIQLYNLLAALVLVMINMFFLEPKATKVMFERMKMEKEEGRGRDMADVAGDNPARAASTVTGTEATGFAAARACAAGADRDAVKSRAAKLNKKLKRFNAYSSLANVLTLMGLTWHLVHLGRHRVACG